MVIYHYGAIAARGSEGVKDRGFYIGHLNIRSIFPKIDILQHFVTDVSNRIGVLGLSETWLHTNLSNDLVDIPNYNIVRNDRGRNSDPNNLYPQKGGGVCLYIREDLEYNYPMDNWCIANCLTLNVKKKILKNVIISFLLYIQFHTIIQFFQWR